MKKMFIFVSVALLCCGVVGCDDQDNLTEQEAAAACLDGLGCNDNVARVCSIGGPTMSGVYSVEFYNVTCADGATCEIRDITSHIDGETQRPYCLVDSDTECDPNDETLTRCVSEYVVERCSPEILRLERYDCRDTGDYVLSFCDASQYTCTADN